MRPRSLNWKPVTALTGKGSRPIRWQTRSWCSSSWPWPRLLTRARVAKAPLPPEAAEVVAQLLEQAGPLGQIGLFLAAVAAGEPVPAVPAGLPPGLAEVLESLVEAVDNG